MVDRALAVGAQGDDRALLLQNAARDLQIDFTVIHHQDAHADQPLGLFLVEDGRLQQRLRPVGGARHRSAHRVEQGGTGQRPHQQAVRRSHQRGVLLVVRDALGNDDDRRQLGDG